MHRIRISLPYFRSFGWEAEVVCVDEKFIDDTKDELLNKTVDPAIKVHRVKALPRKLTGKIGLNALALRSGWHLYRYVCRLLKKEKFDLIYFSTTQFPICILGHFWKKKFKVPYVIDMQDPWYSTYYDDKPKEQRPKKYWLSSGMHKFLEPIAFNSCDGMISVSENYITTIRSRYASFSGKPAAVITFGLDTNDLRIAGELDIDYPFKNNNRFNLLYTGRGGHDMHKAVSPLLRAIADGLKNKPELYQKLHVWFIGTSYALNGEGEKTIQPLAEACSIEHYVTEITDRVPYFNALFLLQKADALFIAGSDDPAYTASKLYPYMASGRPILSVFHPGSSANDILYNCTGVMPLNLLDSETDLAAQMTLQLENWLLAGAPETTLNKEAFEEYTAYTMTKKQVALFEQVLSDEK